MTNVETSRTLEEFLAVAAGLEAKSEHPLAEAIMEFASARGAVPAAVENFRSIPGKGVEGSIGGRMYIAGNQRLMEERHISLANVQKRLETLADEGKTPDDFCGLMRGRPRHDLCGRCGEADQPGKRCVS